MVLNVAKLQILTLIFFVYIFIEQRHVFKLDKISTFQTRYGLSQSKFREFCPDAPP